ncbi:MAG: acyltransferase family protein [Dysgonomonas sp.]
MERISRIDIAKGIGISLVVYGHTFSPFVEFTHMFQMPLFFMLSGYLYNSKDNIKETIIKKTKSLLFPYIFFLILTNLIFVVFCRILGESYHIYPSMLIAPYGVALSLWTFIAVFIACIIFKIIDRTFDNYIYKVSAVFLCFFIGVGLYHFHIKLPFYIDSAFTIVIFYATGYWLKKYTVIEYIIYGGFVVAVIVYALLGHLPSVDLKFNVYSDPLCLFISCGISMFFIRLAGLLDKSNITKSIFSYIGRMTIVILGLHILAFEFLYLIFPRENYLAAVAVSILSIALILLVNKFVKIDVFLNKVRKIKLRTELRHIRQRIGE